MTIKGQWRIEESPGEPPTHWLTTGCEGYLIKVSQHIESDGYTVTAMHKHDVCGGIEVRIPTLDDAIIYAEIKLSTGEWTELVLYPGDIPARCINGRK